MLTVLFDGHCYMTTNSNDSNDNDNNDDDNNTNDNNNNDNNSNDMVIVVWDVLVVILAQCFALCAKCMYAQETVRNSSATSAPVLLLVVLCLVVFYLVFMLVARCLCAWTCHGRQTNTPPSRLVSRNTQGCQK